MTKLHRLRPDPTPTIHPVPEYLVSGQRAQWYAEMKTSFQVPWMGVVTMAFANYPAFFEELWRGLRPLAGSKAFIDGCDALRGFTEHEVRRLQPRSVERRVRAIGYAPREIDEIRASLEIFSHGNFPYLLTATAARRLMEGHEIGAAGTASEIVKKHTRNASHPLVLMEAHHADEQTKALYENIKRTLNLPFVNTDYRALARWPSYFSLAWNELEPIVCTDGYEAICNRVHEFADNLLRASLPNPGHLSPSALRAAARRDGDEDEICRVTQLFQWLLPGLVTNIALFQAQLVE